MQKVMWTQNSDASKLCPAAQRLRTVPIETSLCLSSARYNAFLWKIPHNLPMKQELPIAVGLLAIGGLLWLSGSWADNASNRANQTKAIPSQQTTASIIQQASFQENATASSSSQLPSKPVNPLIAEKDSLRGQGTKLQDFSLPVTDFTADATTQSDSTPSTADYLHAAPDPRSAELLTRNGRRIANSAPFRMSIKLEGHLFDEHTVATGQYFQMGQGTHRSRLDLAFQAGEEVANSFQLCDGRFVYRLQTFGGQQRFEFVDLNRFSQQTNTNATFSPSNWIATGGLASLLEQFNQSFNFGAPKQIVTNNQATLTMIRGCWNETALKHTLGRQAGSVFANLPKIRSRNAIPWNKIPQQLPHSVEVVFGNDGAMGEFPREIRYLKFEPNPNGGAMRLTPMMTLKFSPPEQTDQLTENMFVIRSSDIESVDTTDQYLAQVKLILAMRQAEKKTDVQQQLK